MAEQQSKTEQRPLKPEEQFLAHAVGLHLENGLLTAEQLFDVDGNRPEDIIVKGYGKTAPARRAAVVSFTTGLSMDTAAELEAVEAGSLVARWYNSKRGDDRATKARTLLVAIGADDLQRFGNKANGWARLTEARERGGSKEAREQTVAALLDKLVALKLLGEETSWEIIHSVGFAALAAIPGELLAEALQLALDKGRRAGAKNGEPFRAEHLLSVLSFRVIAKHAAPAKLERVLAVFAERYKLAAPPIEPSKNTQYDDDLRPTGPPPPNPESDAPAITMEADFSTILADLDVAAPTRRNR